MRPIGAHAYVHIENNCDIHAAFDCHHVCKLLMNAESLMELVIIYFLSRKGVASKSDQKCISHCKQKESNTQWSLKPWNDIPVMEDGMQAFHGSNIGPGLQEPLT